MLKIPVAKQLTCKDFFRNETRGFMVGVGVRVDNENSFLLTPGIWHLAFGIWSFSFLRDGLEMISQLVQSGSGPQPTRPKNRGSNLHTKMDLCCLPLGQP